MRFYTHRRAGLLMCLCLSAICIVFLQLDAAIDVNLSLRQLYTDLSNDVRAISTIQHEDQMVSKTADVQRERLKRLAEVCAKYNRSRNMGFDAGMFTLFAEQRLHYLYCMVPKVACSTWKLILAKANGLDKNHVISPDIHESSMDKYVPPFRSYPQMQQRDILRAHFKFMFVRHPFERLVSAHRSKFLELSTHRNHPGFDHFRRINNLIKKRYRKQNLHPMKSQVTFREFVMYLLDPRTRRPFDRHWRPMHELCNPCDIGYDLIGHYETLATDASFVLDKLGVDKTVVQFPSSEYGRRNSSDRVGEALKLLTHNQIESLRRLYKFDFELFGYE